MDPWLAALLGALAASAVWSVVLLWRRPREPTPVRPVRVERPDPEPTSAAAELVPLVFAPVQAFREIYDAAVPEIRSLLAPGGEVALLFSDIAESTKLNAKLGDRAFADMLKVHDETVRDVVRSHGGRVVKTQGDGFMAAFHTPRSAVRAALELEPAVADRLGRRARPRLRIGIHTGEVVSERGDYFGTNVVKAARVAGEAVAGQIVVTDEVVAALDDDDTLAFVARSRPTELRGLKGRHQLHDLARG